MELKNHKLYQILLNVIYHQNFNRVLFIVILILIFDKLNLLLYLYQICYEYDQIHIVNDGLIMLQLNISYGCLICIVIS